MSYQELSRCEIGRRFALLAELLKVRPVFCDEDLTEARIADASEFMLMDNTEHKSNFKHRDTRNYVLVLHDKVIDLHVPVADVPFNRGFFGYGTHAENLLCTTGQQWQGVNTTTVEEQVTCPRCRKTLGLTVAVLLGVPARQPVETIRPTR